MFKAIQSIIFKLMYKFLTHKCIYFNYSATRIVMSRYLAEILKPKYNNIYIVGKYYLHEYLLYP